MVKTISLEKLRVAMGGSEVVIKNSFGKVDMEQLLEMEPEELVNCSVHMKDGEVTFHKSDIPPRHFPDGPCEVGIVYMYQGLASLPTGKRSAVELVFDAYSTAQCYNPKTGWAV